MSAGPTTCLTDIPFRTVLRPVNRETELEPCFALHRAAMCGVVEAVYGPWDEAFQRKMFEDDWLTEDIRGGTEQAWVVVPDAGGTRDTIVSPSDSTADAGSHEAERVAMTYDVLGMLVIVNRTDSVHIGQISVHPSLQGRGVGASLMDWVKTRAREKGLDVTLEVWNVNDGAMRFYKRHGFEKVGEKEGPGRKLKSIMRWSSASEV